MSEITMPKLSDSMEEGTILSWLKADGDAIEAGEDLVEIETDKATMTHPAETSGVLTIVAHEGTSWPVGATIARVAATTEARAEAPASPGGDAEPAATSAIELPASAATPVGANGRGLRTTPLARRVAAVHGVDLEAVSGSGPHGRITRNDVLRKVGLAAESQSSPLAPQPAAVSQDDDRSRPVSAAPESAAPGAKGAVEIIEPTRLQALVARRMAESKATVPHFQVQAEVVMDAAIGFRAELKNSGADIVPSLNDLIVKAAALALRDHPLANGAWRDSKFERYSRVNIGIAVASDDALIVPTIFDADEKSLGMVAAEARRLAARVREGTVSPPELAGGTFTVSNLGMYGMTAITPVVNAPQAAILGVGALREVLMRDGAEIVDRTLLTLTLSCDHRILYGAQAAQLLNQIRELLERPVRLAL
jgi:pyruvate dehydrogenase E2 component (dihydrolipoamide acetyltransferase)